MATELPFYMVFTAENVQLILFGPEFATRTDGTDKFLMAQAYQLTGETLTPGSIVEGHGMRLKPTADLAPPWAWTGCVLEVVR